MEKYFKARSIVKYVPRLDFSLVFLHMIRLVGNSNVFIDNVIAKLSFEKYIDKQPCFS